jgi:hypothetical protein
MNKRAKVFACVSLWVFLVVMIALAIPTFTHSAYHLVSGVLAFLSSGGLLISVGIFKIPKVKAQGEHISWWKQPSIMVGIGYICFAIVLFIKLNPNWTNNQFFDSTGFLMILLSFGLVIYGFIYGLVLMFQRAARRRDLSNPAKTNRKGR